MGRQETAANIILFISEKYYPRHCLAYPLYISIGASLWLNFLPIDEEVHFAENHGTGYAGHFLDEMPTMLTEYSDVIARRLVEKITIYDEKIVVELKSGLQMEVEA